VNCFCIAAGVDAVLLYIASVLADEEVPQAFNATTLIFPETKEEANTTLTFVVPCPETNVAPVGTVHK
jgi:hypothetical protein